MTGIREAHLANLSSASQCRAPKFPRAQCRPEKAPTLRPRSQSRRPWYIKYPPTQRKQHPVPPGKTTTRKLDWRICAVTPRRWSESESAARKNSRFSVKKNESTAVGIDQSPFPLTARRNIISQMRSLEWHRWRHLLQTL